MKNTRNNLLLADDDVTYCDVLSRALFNRDFNVAVAFDKDNAISKAASFKPDFAVVDLRIGDNSGLRLIPELLKINNNMLIVVMTGYASIATAVEAIKLGAIHYLTKPTDADEIMAAIQQSKGKDDIEIRDKPLSLDRVEWEYIQKTLSDCDGNISAAARQLGLHRRTLQRKLQKRPAKLS